MLGVVGIGPKPEDSVRWKTSHTSCIGITWHNSHIERCNNQTAEVAGAFSPASVQ